MKTLFLDTRNMFKDRIFLHKAVVIALPVALQGMLNTIVNLVDIMMIGSLQEATISAVGLANKVFFVFSLLVFGVVSGSGVLAAQYWGNHDVKNIRKVLGISLLISLIGSLFFVIPSQLCPNLVMQIFTSDKEAISIGAVYLTIAALSYPFIAITNTYVAMMRAVGQVKPPVLVSCLAIIINITLNYTLIFGHFGVPALGAAGAALATLIARMIECTIIVCVVYKTKSPIACRINDMIGYSKDFVRQFLSTTAPVIANEFIWGLGTTIYFMVYGRMGNAAVAAITISTTIQDIVVVLFQGLSAATAVILGNEMGAGKLKRAEVYAKNFLILQFLLTLISAAFCYAIRWNVIALYDVSAEVAENISHCLTMFAWYMPVKMFNYINIVGVLRSGGDTKVCLFIDTSGVWVIGIPMAVIGGLWLAQPIYIVYAMVMVEEVYKAILGYLRYRQKKWLRNLTLEMEQQPIHS